MKNAITRTTVQVHKDVSPTKGFDDKKEQKLQEYVTGYTARGWIISAKKAGEKRGLGETGGPFSAAMENADVLNQIRRSNNEAILGDAGSRGRKYLGGLHFRLAGATDRRRFEFLTGKVRTAYGDRGGGWEIRETSISRLASSAPCNVCISNFLRVALHERTDKIKRARETDRWIEKRTERFIEFGKRFARDMDIYINRENVARQNVYARLIQKL